MILLISAVFPPEPVVSAQISLELAYSLSVIGEVVVISPKPSRPAGSIYTEQSNDLLPFKKITLKSYISPGQSMIGRMIESISFGHACRKFIKANSKKISLIYANTWPLFAQLAVAKASSKYNILLVTHVQDIYPETLTNKLDKAGFLVKKLLLPIDSYILKKSKVVIAIGHRMADYLVNSRGIPASEIEVIYNWQDEARFHKVASRHKKNEYFTFVYLGSISPSANIESVINAFGKTELKKLKLIIAGSGNSKKTCTTSASKYPDRDITFIDAPSYKTPELLSMADVLILPLKKGVGKYSIPSKLAGYMHSGKPVLAYIDADSDAADIIIDAGCGWVVQSGDEPALVKKMEEVVIMQDETLSKYGSAGKVYALQYLSKKANLEKLIEAIERVLV